MFKEQKGITLVALVVTIIVLLILAGVSISLVLGNNGVLKQASNSVVANKEGAAEEAVAMAIASCETDYLAAWTANTATTRKEIFETKFSGYLLSAGYYVGDSDSVTNSTSTTFAVDASDNHNLAAHNPIYVKEVASDGSTIKVTLEVVGGTLKTTGAEFIK